MFVPEKEFTRDEILENAWRLKRNGCILTHLDAYIIVWHNGSVL
jgi:hypothetical protein